MTYLIVAFVAWLVAQSLKFAFKMTGRNQRVFKGNPRGRILLSGGMPSGHSATVVALTTIIAMKDGVDSGLFALAALFSAIVMYDAVMVRYSSGRQGELLNRLLAEVSSKLGPTKVAHGHTILEVAGGAVLGLVVGCVVFFTIR